jgi:hypothetical protein
MRVIAAERFMPFRRSHDSMNPEIEPLSNMTKMLFAAALVLSLASVTLAASSPAFAKHRGHGYARHHHGLISSPVSLRTGRGMMNRASQTPGGGDK